MSARRHKRKSPLPASKIMILILLAVVGVQAYLLWGDRLQAVFQKLDTGRLIEKREHLPQDRKTVKTIKPAPPTYPAVDIGKPQIGIIIDDNGYHDDCAMMQQIGYPIAISVLPNLRYSRTVAQCAQTQNKEVMLHLPMEPHHNDDKYPEGYLIKTTDEASTVVDKLMRALDNVPFVKGVNNHMGSKATENVRLMSIIFGQLNKNNLFFIDSRVTAKTVCPRLAHEKKLPFNQRDVFLDNTNDRDYIEAQFAQLTKEARKQGYAIGIGHARPLTWQIVKEQLSRLQAEGFIIVPISRMTNLPTP